MRAATVEDWDRLMALNMRGVMLSYKYAAIQMIKQGRGGRIIGIDCITPGQLQVMSINLEAYRCRLDGIEERQYYTRYAAPKSS